MRYLVFRPRPAQASDFFLWGPALAGGRPAVLERLAASGRDSTARVVTGEQAIREVTGLSVPLMAAVEALADVDAQELDRLPASVAAWSLGAKLALDLVARERVVPLARPCRGGAEARWGVSLALPGDHERFQQLARALPPAAHALVDGGLPGPRRGRRRPRPARPWSPEALLLEFLDATADALVRAAAAEAGVTVPGNDRRWERLWLLALATPDGDRRFLGDGYPERTLLEELGRWTGPARGRGSGPRLALKLDLPPERNGAGPGRPRWPLGYFLQAPDDPSLLLPAARVWSETGLPSWAPAGRAEPPQEVLLRDLAYAARLFRPIQRSLEAARPEGVGLTDDEAWQFLAEGAPLLAEAGFTIRVPLELTPSGQRRLRLRLRVGGTSTAGVVAGASRLDLDALVTFRWEVALGDQALTAEEFRALIALKRPLVQWRGEWVVLDPAELVQMARLVEGARGGKIPVRDALAAALAGTALREELPVPVEIAPEGPLAAAVARLRAEPEPVPPPEGLAGVLRPYQARGVGWLQTLARLGLGGCLADDMGLGKTVQAIAFLLARRAGQPRDGRPALVVCPTSVIGNWERELRRFAPTLPVIRHHGPDRARSPGALAAAPPHAVVVTTYAILRRDLALLAEVDWAAVILDEAQNIKNPAARQAAAARALRATHRFALTGTPIENRLAELWSILEFCVPGLLGPLARFRRRFAIPVERYRDERAADELRRLVRPFVLRRVKSDPAVAVDLPPKDEITVVCTLTREQASLYQAAVEEALAAIEGTSGIERRGRVLALLTALKQICNHPAHYLREPGPFPGRSGKLDRLTEMLEETAAAGDWALVFTQFREMGTRLVRHLRQVLGVEVPFLHGGVDPAAREEMVRRFQEAPAAPPVFVVSLRAGGTGLNLTRATRVFHFDRWWNPAVEDQATDRAHRIGQTQPVQVYRLVTAGTVEEKIDAMLRDKRALADRVVGPDETWITDLSDAELRELVALSTDAVVDAEDAEDPVAAGTGARAGRRA